MARVWAGALDPILARVLARMGSVGRLGVSEPMGPRDTISVLVADPSGPTWPLQLSRETVRIGPRERRFAWSRGWSRSRSRFASRSAQHARVMTAEGLELLADQLDAAAGYAAFLVRPGWARAFRRASRRARRFAAEERSRVPVALELVAGSGNFGQYCGQPSEPRSVWLGSPNSQTTGAETDGSFS